MTSSEPDPHKLPLTDTPRTADGRYRATVRTFTPRWRMSPRVEELMERLLPQTGALTSAIMAGGKSLREFEEAAF